MKFYPLMWCFFILSCFSCVPHHKDAKLAVDKTEHSRYCPFCQSTVAVAGDKAANLGDDLGHFHEVNLPIEKDKQEAILEKAKGWAEKADLPNIYVQAAAKGAIPLQVMLKLSEKDRKLIGAPLTRFDKATKRDVKFDLAGVDGKHSVFCPICRVMVDPKLNEHKHGQTAYNVLNHAEQPYDFAQGRFWAEIQGGKDGSGAVQWCTQCKVKASLADHVHGLTHYCDVCKVEVLNVGHIHFQTQYCSKCSVDGRGVQAVYGLEKAGHVHGGSQFCPVCRTEMPYEEIILGDKDEPIRGFVNDMIQVVKDGDEMKKLDLLRAKIQEYKGIYSRWPESLQDIKNAPSLDTSGMAFEYSKITGRARIIRTDPSPKVLVIRGLGAKFYERGYLDGRGEEHDTSAGYVKKNEKDPFEIQRKVFDMVIEVKYFKDEKGRKTNITKAVIGIVESYDSSSVTIVTPDDLRPSFNNATYVLAKPKDFTKINEKELWNQVMSQSKTIKIIKIFLHKQEGVDGEEGRAIFHDHSYLLKKIPVITGSSPDDYRVEWQSKENPISQWKYLSEEVAKTGELEKKKKGGVASGGGDGTTKKDDGDDEEDY